MKRTAKAALAARRVVANRTWGVDHDAIDSRLKHLLVTGPRPAWASDLAELFVDVADAIASGSPDARVWAITQLRTVAEAFDPDCSIPRGI
jgi:hypothetical protein